jgi:hypothetical protein
LVKPLAKWYLVHETITASRFEHATTKQKRKGDRTGS